jgi:hypothetical protein
MHNNDGYPYTGRINDDNDEHKKMVTGVFNKRRHSSNDGMSELQEKAKMAGSMQY